MNKHLHRIIFNKARGILMAVAECAASHRRGDARVSGESDIETTASWLLKPAALGVLLLLSGAVGFIPYAAAQVVADPGAAKNQQPTILNATNGVPLINIQTPSAAGVSRNTYSQFDVQANGAILNNARTNAQTQLGGWVQGNPSLATGTARVILNEVNSNAPSQLRGYIEVGGDRAQVVLANPAGITCDGCGFINANRATLTTGTPNMNGGSLDGFRVERGQIIIQGNGLDATQVDYTDLIARSIQVNAGIWANTLKLTAGANQVSTDNSQASPIAGSGPAPAFAIDVAQLGGMYAGKITLVGSETGVGVRNAGHLGASAGDVSISVDGLLGNSGQISSGSHTAIDAASGIVNSGTLYALANSTLSTRGNLDNNGVIAALGALTLAATGSSSQITGSAGSLFGAGLQADGRLVPGGDLVMNASQRVSALGQNLSGAALSITAGHIDLHASQTLAAHIALTAGSGDIDIRQGSLNADGTLQASTTGTLQNDQAHTAAGQLILTARELSNVQGELIQTGSAAATVNLVGALDNTGGIIGSNGATAINIGSLDNRGGIVMANQHLQINSAGLLVNSGKLQAGNSLALVAGTLDNQAAGEISAQDVTLNVGNSLSNRGLIDGSETRLTAVTVDNLGSGRLYGDHLAVAAGTLNNTPENGTAPVIAARQRLDLGVGALNNTEHALIYSAGDMAIGGALDGNARAIGTTGSVNNASASLEAQGNLAISANSLHNSNLHFATQPVLVSQTALQEYQLPGSGNRWTTPLAAVTPDPGEKTKTLWTPEGSSSDGQFYEYSYIRSVVEDQVSGSDPGQIRAGGNMDFRVASLTNDKSQIVAGGALNLIGGTLNNIMVSGQQITTDSGTATYYWYIHHHNGKKRDQGASTTGYAPAPTITSIDLSPTRYLANAAPGITAPAVGALSIIQVPGTSSPLTGHAQALLPNNALYHQNPGPNSHYLIETDPRFADYRTWLGSDYLLQQLAIDPAHIHKRLGDGFYEQKLIRDQVAQLTGRRFLDGYANDEQEYQALMDHGVTVARAWNLRPGVALSAAQVAQLTSDIVWLVEREVTLADGSTQTVLAPQIYLAPRSGDLAASGALIAGHSLHLDFSGDLANSGTLAGRQVVSLSAENIRNLGRITGHDVQLATRTDLDNLGGRIDAQASLALTAGRDIKLATTTQRQSNAQGSRTNIDRLAGLYVTGATGSLTAIAGRDLKLAAAEVINAGSGPTLLAAGNNFSLGAVTESNSQNTVWNSRNHNNQTNTADIGSRIASGGDLSLLAGNDLTGQAADLQAQGNLNLQAGNDIALSAGQSTLSLDQASHTQSRSKGLLGGSTRTDSATYRIEQRTAVGSTLGGQNLSLQAGRDISLEAVRLTAQDTLALTAGRDLSLTAAESTEVSSERHQRTTKENLGFGQQSLKTTRDESTVIPEVSQLSGKKITLQAARDLTLVAPQIQAETISASAGNQLTVTTATATHEQKETSEFKTNRFNVKEVTNPRVTGGRIKDKIKLSATGSERRAVVADISANSVALQSGGDTVLVAPRIKAEHMSVEAGTIDGQTVNLDARIQLLGIKESTTTSSSKNSHSFVHETVRDGGTSQESLLLPNIQLSGTTSQTTQLALAAPGGIVVGATSLAPTQREQQQAGTGTGSANAPTSRPYDLKTQAAALSQQPGLAWLGDLTKRNDVDWQKIELAQQNWDYKHAGLTQEGAAIVTIVVTALTWGAGSGIGGAVEGATGSAAAGAAAGAAASAAVSTLASQAAVSLINNQGDVGKTLQDLGSKDSIKQIVASMLTAGIGQGLTSAMGLPSLTADPSFANRFATYATKAAVAAGVQSAVFGTPLSETAKTALVNSLAQTLTSEIGDWGKSDSALVAKTLAHAVVQCAAASIQNNDCGSAALGAAVAEVISPLLDQLDDRTKAAGYQQSIGSSIAGMSAMLVAGLTGQDALSALNSAQMVDYYNRALHLQENNALKAAAKKLAADAVAGREVTKEQQQQLENYWFDQLESEARAKVDAKAAGIRQTYLDQVSATNQPGYAGGAANYLADAQLAREVVAGLAGTVLYGTDGKPIIADGAELRAFQATTAQYNDSQLLLANNTSTLIRQFGSQEAANNAQATQSRWDNISAAIGHNTREAGLLKAFQTPSEGVQTAVPEAYLVGTGGLVRSIVSGVVGAGKVVLGAETENVVGNALHPLQGMTPAQVVQEANTLGLKTPKDALLLWSGFGKEGPAISQAYALQYGGVTLEMTPGGAWLTQMNLYAANSPFMRVEADLIWGKVSELLVRQASGQVRSVLGDVRPTSIYLSREIPELQFNLFVPGVDQIYLRPAHVTQIVKP